MDYYFVGIAGTAMASVAAALKAAGHSISGSDAGVYPPMSDFLARQGIPYHDAFHESNIDGFLNDAAAASRPACFVIGNAISRGNPEVERILDLKADFVSLAALAGGELIWGRKSAVFAGTHGKTTTSSLAAWTLESAGRKPGFLIGGMPVNFGRGCRPAPPGGVFVTEGDEYDTAFFDKRSKFVHYRPDIFVINNVEFDHADIFRSIDDVVEAFRMGLRLVPRGGLVLVNGDDARALEAATGAQAAVRTFGLGAGNDWRAAEITIEDGGSSFSALRKDGDSMRGFRFYVPLAGEFNVRNALAVIAALDALEISNHEIEAGFSSFLGVRRRMETAAEARGIIVIDDFAHHPTAVRETVRALRIKYPSARLRIVFEPRSNTTTRNIFQAELAAAFDGADEVVLGPVNRPERYSPEQLLDRDRLAADISSRGPAARAARDPAEAARIVLSDLHEGDVIVVMSNGGFGGMTRMLVNGITA